MLPKGSRLHAGGGDGNVVDRLSGLPDELLLVILGALGSVRAAVRTGVLSRRWRGLWTSLPDLAFGRIDPDLVEPVLAQVTRPALDLLDIFAGFPLDARGVSIERRRLSSILCAAARQAPKKLVLATDETETKGDDAVQLPCLDRTVSLAIAIQETPLALPPFGEFTALRSLSIEWCRIDIRALLPLCPNLRVLKMHQCVILDGGVKSSEEVIHAPSIEELKLTTGFMDRLEIVAPALKKMKVKLCVTDPLTVSLVAPLVESSKWSIILDDTLGMGDSFVSFGLWLLNYMCQEIVEGQIPCLSIVLEAFPDALPRDWDFAQGIALLPGANFSRFYMEIHPEGHVLGPVVLHLLGIQPGIQMLEITVEQNEKEELSCPVNCPCEESSNWRSDKVALTRLEVIMIAGLEGTDHEIDLLRVLFRCATVLQKMSVTLSRKASSSAYKEIRRLFKQYSNVKCFIYKSREKRAKPIESSVGNEGSPAVGS